jgi:prepilin-type N-terminal cleavage/methylation domain-containing protein
MIMVKNEKGITLVELLAALALLSIILILASSIHLFTQNQMNNQIQAVQSESDVSLAISTITKNIRSASSVTVKNNVLTVITTSTTNVYQLNGTSLTKNNQPIITGIKQFVLTPDTPSDHVTITITSNEVNPTTLTTTIYYRK